MFGVLEREQRYAYDSDSIGAINSNISIVSHPSCTLAIQRPEKESNSIGTPT